MSKRRITNLDFRKADVKISAWKNPLRFSPGEKRDPRELVDIQGSPCPNPSSTPTNRKASKGRRRPAWLSKELLFEL